MKNDFTDTRLQLSRKFEDLIIEISSLTTPKGILFLVDDAPTIKEFTKLMDSCEKCYLSNSVVIIPGDRKNED